MKILSGSLFAGCLFLPLWLQAADAETAEVKREVDRIIQGFLKNADGDALSGIPSLDSEFNIVAKEDTQIAVLKINNLLASNNQHQFDLKLKGPLAKQGRVNIADLDGLGNATTLTLGYSFNRINRFFATSSANWTGVLSDSCDYIVRNIEPDTEIKINATNGLIYPADDAALADPAKDRVVTTSASTDTFAKLADSYNASITPDQVGIACDTGRNNQNLLGYAKFREVSFLKFGITGEFGKPKFTYYDPAVPADKIEMEKTVHDVAVYVARYGYSSTWALKYSTAKLYKEEDETNYCSPATNAGNFICGQKRLAAPAQIKRRSVSLEYRKNFGSYAISPIISRDQKNSVTSIKVPVYLVPDPKDKLSGGISLAWDNKVNDVTASIFLSTPFSLTDLSR